MSKYPIKFPDNTTLWQTTANCNFCKTIDKIYTNVFNNYKNDFLNKESQALLYYLDKNYLVNGYQLLLVYEKNYANNLFHNIATLKTYQSNSLAFMNEVYRQHCYEKFNSTIGGNPYKPVLLHGRWCQFCGARKPSIYDTEREIDND